MHLQKNNLFSGTSIAVLEILVFIYFSYMLRLEYTSLKNINIISYYWLLFTILTFIWETSYIIHFKKISNLSKQLIHKKQHVWTNRYDVSFIIPSKLATIFYAEYAAYADREYMLVNNNWSRVIEGTHAYICGIFAIFCIYYKINNNQNNYLISVSLSMGAQLMNSILYISNYLIQTQNIHNVNYNSIDFPTGYLLLKRPFMYINIFWTIMPLYVLINDLL
tara:strand:- start:80 stop:742 length:663 start_codon:yes stop_codon:yes gene_type:complete